MENKRPLVYLICGVSGSGKTWVAKQLVHKFTYVPHDDHYRNLVAAIVKTPSTKPYLTECPFGERILRDEMVKAGLAVKPYFIIERPDVVSARYLAREGRPISQSALTRALSILSRAKEWEAPYGTSQEILHLLGTQI